MKVITSLWLKSILSLLVIFMFIGGLIAQPIIITDNTASSALNDGIINPSEYIGFSTGINGGFGNVMGNLSMWHIDSDVNGNIHFGFQSGNGELNNQGVIYFDCIPGGFTNTTLFTDNADGGRAICSAIGATNPSGRADIYFPAGFEADFAISIESGFSSIFELVSGGSHNWLGSANITPIGNATAAQWEFNFNLSLFGLEPGASLKYIISYGNAWDGSGLYRSDEFHGVANATVSGGNIGINSVTLAPGDYNVFNSIGRFNWVGNSDSDWNNPSNWENGLVPTAQYDAFIPSVSKASPPVISGTASVLSLIMMTGSSLTISPTGSLTVAGTFTNNGSLTLQSDATGTASLIETSGVNASVARYMTANRWHYVSSPITNATANSFLGIYLQYYDEPSQLWQDVTSTSSPLTTGVGYSAWSAGSVATPTYSGTLNTGTVVLPISNSGNRWNFVANPYPSAVSWEGSGWSKTDLDAAAYVWNGSNYISYASGVGGLTGGIIPAQQSFFVRAAEFPVGTPTLSVSDAARVHGVDPYKSKSNVEVITLRVKGNTYSDETFIALNIEASLNVDGQYDAYKLMGIEEAPQLYTVAQDENLSINAIPEITKGLSIPLGLEVGVEGIYELSLANVEGFENIPLFLEDLKENKIVNLKSNSLYKCEASPMDESNRFILHFNYVEGNTSSGVSDNNVVFIIPKDKSVMIISGQMLNAMVIIYDLLGQEITSQQLSGVSTTLIPLNAKPGYYIVRVQTEAGIKSKKLFID